MRYYNNMRAVNYVCEQLKLTKEEKAIIISRLKPLLKKVQYYNIFPNEEVVLDIFKEEFPTNKDIQRCITFQQLVIYCEEYNYKHGGVRVFF